MNLLDVADMHAELSHRASDSSYVTARAIPMRAAAELLVVSSCAARRRPRRGRNSAGRSRFFYKIGYQIEALFGFLFAVDALKTDARTLGVAVSDIP